MGMWLTDPAAVTATRRPIVKSISIDPRKLRIELARTGLTLTELARRLDLPPTTLGSWVRAVHPPPADLSDRVAAVLGVAAHAITADA
jgi:transcriptional regulator with XRE-family HTH domain